VSHCFTSGTSLHLPSSSDFEESVKLKDVMLVSCEPRENSVVSIVETPVEEHSYHGGIDKKEDMEDKTRERRLSLFGGSFNIANDCSRELFK